MDHPRLIWLCVLHWIGGLSGILSDESLLPSTFSERIYPHYQDISPCPCDLRVEQCDPGCCCDPACPEDYSRNLTCIPSLGGGNHSEGHFVALNCSSVLLPTEKDYLHDLLCIYSSNSPYLGHFYSEEEIIITKSQYDNVRIPGSDVDRKVPVSYEDTTNQFKEDLKISKYTYGSEIGTLFDSQRGIFGKLKLPQNSLNGLCLPSPIRFLQPVSSRCLHFLSQSQCSEGARGVLDHRSYLSKSLSEEVRQKFGSSRSTNLTVRFFQTRTPEKHLTSIHRVPLGSKKPEPLRDNLSDIGKKLQSPRARRPFNGLHRDQDLELVAQDGYENHLLLDQEIKLCLNVVLFVEYQLHWNGTSIVQVGADILLGDLAVAEEINVSSRLLSQFFQANFIHVNSSRQRRSISGQPGYESGLALISGRFANDQFERDPQGLAHWHPGPNSLCRDAELLPLAFGVDIASGCRLMLARSDFDNCSKLSKQIQTLQEILMQSEWVARGGHPNSSHPDDFVPILYHDSDPPNVTSSSEIARCYVPSRLHLEIFFANSVPRPLRRIDRISGIKAGTQFQLWTWQCSNLDDCTSPKAFELDIFVKFEEIPLRWHHQNTSKFWVLQDDVHCSGDNCWKQILRPFTHPESEDIAFTGNIVGGILLLGCPVLLWLTRQHW